MRTFEMPINEQPTTTQVHDLENAMVAGRAEKKVRDPIIESGITLSPDEKTLFGGISGRIGEQAIRDYRANQEKLPSQQLLGKLVELETKMSEAGDKKIAQELLARLQAYFTYIMQEWVVLQEDEGIRLKFGRAATIEPNVFRNTLPITDHHQDGHEGLYYPNGLCAQYVNDRDINTPATQQQIDRGARVVSGELTKKGQEQLFKSLGLFGSDEEVVDFFTKYEKQMSIGYDPKNFKIELPTNIQHVSLLIENFTKANAQNAPGQKIQLKFADQLLDQLHDAQ